MKLKKLPFDLTVCKVEDISAIDLSAKFFFIARTAEELSLVCRTEDVPEKTVERVDGWRGFCIEGVLDFSLTGILSGLSSILAENRIGIFAVSTFNTDYILVKAEDFDRAMEVLAAAGYEVTGSGHGVKQAGFRKRLCAMVSDPERTALENGGDGLYISSFNRQVMLRMLTGGADEGPDADEQAVRELTADLKAYLNTYMSDHPEGHKWIILACLYLTFVEKLPMHPREAAKWQRVDGRFLCPNKVEDSLTCQYCVCESMK